LHSGDVSRLQVWLPHPSIFVVVVVEVVVVELVEVVVVVVVVVPVTHWLFSQMLPGSHVPQLSGVPQPSLISPHWALSAAHEVGPQHTPNLSAGWSVMQSLLRQLLCTWHCAPSGLPPALLKSANARTAINVSATERYRFMEPAPWPVPLGQLLLSGLQAQSQT
jgi:hypothetical protein